MYLYYNFILHYFFNNVKNLFCSIDFKNIKLAFCIDFLAYSSIKLNKKTHLIYMELFVIDFLAHGMSSIKLNKKIRLTYMELFVKFTL